jgi:signal transduction histidine kinase/HAMP domain-containing protein
MSIKTKLILALALLALIIVANSALMWFSARDQNLRLVDGRERFVASAGKAANMVVQIKELSLHTSEIQKHLVEQSALGLDTSSSHNLDQVAYHTEQFQRRLEGATNAAKEIQLTEASQLLAKIPPLFANFLAIGQDTAAAYQSKNAGQAADALSQFDTAAEDLVIVLDTLAWKSQLHLSATIDGAGQEIDQVAAESGQLVSLVIGLAFLSMATIAVIAYLLYGDILKPLYGMTKVMNRLANDEMDIIVPTFNRGDEIGEMAQALADFKTSKLAQRSADSMRMLLNKMPLGVFYGKPDGTIDFANSYARTMFNVAGKEVRGMHISQFLPSLAGAEDIEMALLDEIERSSFVTARRYGGLEFKSDVQMSPADETAGWLWTVRDVSKKLQADQRRAQLEAELRNSQKLESLGTMAGGIAHELNTPIQFITDNTNFLRSAFDDMMHAVEELKAIAPTNEVGRISGKYDLEYLATEAPQAVAQSLEGLTRVAEIVLAIKRFSHPSASGLSENSLNEIVKTTATVSRNQWKYIAELEMNLDPNLPTVQSNAGELNQVLINLIVNAAHAIEDKKAPDTKGRITVTTRKVSDGVECWVADNGTGIPPQIADKIFDLFFTTKQPGRGTGQGLSVVHSIITRTHKGKIWVESEVGRGTTFKFLLPFAPEQTEVN